MGSETSPYLNNMYSDSVQKWASAISHGHSVEDHTPWASHTRQASHGNSFESHEEILSQQPFNDEEFNATSDSDSHNQVDEHTGPEDYDDWVIQVPHLQYHGAIDDLNAFQQARDSRPNHAYQGLDERKYPEIVGSTRTLALDVFCAIKNTSMVLDGGQTQAVQMMEEGHWDDDTIWRASWKIVVSLVLRIILGKEHADN